MGNRREKKREREGKFEDSEFFFLFLILYKSTRMFLICAVVIFGSIKQTVSRVSK